MNLKKSFDDKYINDNSIFYRLSKMNGGSVSLKVFGHRKCM